MINLLCKVYNIVYLNKKKKSSMNTWSDTYQVIGLGMTMG
jgi:hypothetical protein